MYIYIIFFTGTILALLKYKINLSIFFTWQKWKKIIKSYWIKVSQWKYQNLC